MSRSLLTITFLLCILTVTAPTSALSPQPFSPLPNEVNHTMTIRVSIVGIADVDQQQLLWNLEPTIMPTIQSSHNPQGYSEMTYGTKFPITYDIQTSPNKTAADLASYLKSIGKNQSVPEYLQGTGYFSSKSDNI